MKVILLKDVAKIGQRTQVVEVPDGYAMNQLIPKGMAEAATPANMKRIERAQADADAAKAAGEARFEKALKALQATKVAVKAETNEQGHLFKAVSEKDIAEAATTAGVDVDEAMLVVGEPIKEVGDHTVSLMIGSRKEAFTIEVVKNS